MHELFNLNDQLTKFRMLEAKVSSKLEHIPAVRQDPQPVLSTTVYNTNHDTRNQTTSWNI